MGFGRDSSEGGTGGAVRLARPDRRADVGDNGLAVADVERGAAVAADQHGLHRVTDDGGRAVVIVLEARAIPRRARLGVGPGVGQVRKVERLACVGGEREGEGQRRLRRVGYVGDLRVDEDDGGEFAGLERVVRHDAVVVGGRLAVRVGDLHGGDLGRAFFADNLRHRGVGVVAVWTLMFWFLV